MSYGWTYLWQGGLYDLTTGLYSFQRRDYSTTLGTWLENDPAGYIDGPNTYQAMLGAPIEKTDPYGLDAGPAESTSSGSGSAAGPAGAASAGGDSTGQPTPTPTPTVSALGAQTQPATRPAVWPGEWILLKEELPVKGADNAPNGPNKTKLTVTTDADGNIALDALPVAGPDMTRVNHPIVVTVEPKSRGEAGVFTPGDYPRHPATVAVHLTGSGSVVVHVTDSDTGITNDVTVERSPAQ